MFTKIKNALLSKKKLIGYPALPYTNYGSVLQSYAVYSIVKKLGYDCKIINHKNFVDNTMPSDNDIIRLNLDEPNNIMKENDEISKEERKKLENDVMKYRFEIFCKKIFEYDEDLKDLNRGQSSEYNRVKSYDAFICGSDQIWNPHGGWLSPANYLQFAPKNKRIVYAGSIGQSRISFKKQGNIPIWKHYLSELTFLSAREKRTAEVISELTGKKVYTVLDPTLLFSSSWWCNALPDPKLPNVALTYINDNKKYILAYLLHGAERYREKIQAYANKYNLEILWLTGTDISLEKGVNRVETNPSGFIELVKHADCICTDSFHGLCFSIIFEKRFVSTIIGGMDINNNIYDIRKYDLLSRLSLSKRAVDEHSFHLIGEDIDFKTVYNLLEIERDNSISYLEKALCECSNNKVNNEDLPIDLEIKKFFSDKQLLVVPPNEDYNCTGCGACQNLCPVDAIEMKYKNGFIEPVVNRDTCINCSKCFRECTVNKKIILDREKDPKVFAAWSLDPEVILNSSSGGLFSEFAKWILHKDGFVYASSFTENNEVVTERIDSYTKIENVRGSKYLQGNTNLSFRDVKRDLENNNYVLFCGTTCQIDGLYRYLDADYDKLFTIDFICGGVASHIVFKNFILMREEQAKSKIKKIKFRTKIGGWGEVHKFEFENNKKYINIFDYDPYGILFLKKFILRPSCYKCNYKGTGNRIFDVTLGDFWGIGKLNDFKHPRSQGVSAVILNSIKGRILFQHLNSMPGILFSEERTIDDVIKGNPALIKRPIRPIIQYKVIESFLRKNFFDAFIEWFGPYDIRDTRVIKSDFDSKV